MDIDARIQEILLRSSPVNDNNTQNYDTCNPNLKTTNSGINIVGNNNIIISSSVLTSIIISLVFFTFLSCFR